MTVESATAQWRVRTALPGKRRAMRSWATWAISVHGCSTLTWGASWPAATKSTRRPEADGGRFAAEFGEEVEAVERRAAGDEELSDVESDLGGG